MLTGVKFGYYELYVIMQKNEIIMYYHVTLHYGIMKKQKAQIKPAKTFQSESTDTKCSVEP